MGKDRVRRSSARFLILLVVALVAVVSLLGYLASRPSAHNDVNRVVLTPVPGVQPTDLPQKLKDAAAVLRLRLAAFDKRAQVLIEGHQLVVEAPASLGDQLERLGSPGQLEMRPVLAQAPAPSDCNTVRAPSVGDLDRGLTACSQDGTLSYTLGPARLTGSSVRGAVANDAGLDRQIVVQLTPLGRMQFTRLTRELVGKPVPRDELAIVVDGVVLSAPEVRGVIVGDTAISGEFTREQAQALAVTIRYGGLPIAFAISKG